MVDNLSRRIEWNPLTKNIENINSEQNLGHKNKNMEYAKLEDTTLAFLEWRGGHNWAYESVYDIISNYSRAKCAFKTSISKMGLGIFSFP